ncbi:MAG: ACT domain-containing protein [Lachnospiraceae bacterium]|uniref:ACT domain-containing protein n=1 Tax=Candidatus Enterocloster excrementigallinarum TaxID=2838558 RepID=A0A9D2PXK2_9FIRM|nr:ACT domain-containing protein [Lachnospiraceae bacterium]HJC67080.1 ACT domain-containing protein [Candidatus Enterocloster excrementigallinarum]
MQGILDFSLIGILAKLASLLAEHNISIFAVSAFNTDSSNRYISFSSAVTLPGAAAFFTFPMVRIYICKKRL